MAKKAGRVMSHAACRAIPTNKGKSRHVYHRAMQVQEPSQYMGAYLDGQDDGERREGYKCAEGQIQRLQTRSFQLFSRSRMQHKRPAHSCGGARPAYACDRSHAQDLLMHVFFLYRMILPGPENDM
jgi:hypothetical protein